MLCLSWVFLTFQLKEPRLGFSRLAKLYNNQGCFFSLTEAPTWFQSWLDWTQGARASQSLRSQERAEDRTYGCSLPHPMLSTPWVIRYEKRWVKTSPVICKPVFQIFNASPERERDGELFFSVALCWASLLACPWRLEVTHGENNSLIHCSQGT